jgi:hypothetical protein
VEQRTPPTRPAPPSRHVRAVLPGDLHERLRHLSLDLGVSLAALLAEGGLLVARYHGRGAGLSEPMAPVGSRTAPVLTPAPQGPKTATVTAAPTSLRDVVPPAAAVALTADVEDYLSVDSVLRDAFGGQVPDDTKPSINTNETTDRDTND